ncbi:hypothetical protein HYFRA_00009286 [Hymenoscyphus fraxineus]|uniref:Uncharacterized protein n=1 Tax=Hymenoscyphus fraxineus TaxID=746836 RepID=A0A9N9KZ24_9HELO|nr:hypothetical protein HYFRA_00009286 [Hymenoscyphus fraxineus]
MTSMTSVGRVQVVVLSAAWRPWRAVRRWFVCLAAERSTEQQMQPELGYGGTTFAGSCDRGNEHGAVARWLDGSMTQGPRSKVQGDEVQGRYWSWNDCNP